MRQGARQNASAPNDAAARAQADAYGVERAMTIEEAAAAEDIELAVVLTPASAHYGIIRQMLSAAVGRMM